MRAARLFNLLTLLFLGLTAVVALWYAGILIAPDSFLNPLRPLPQIVIVTPTPVGTPTQTRPPTWTPSPTAPTPTPRPSATPSATSTRRPTRTPLPTSTPTPSITPTPTEDVCKTLKLLGPPPGQKFFQYDTPILTWTFGRALAPDEHFDVLIDPPGASRGSVGWADEADPKNKNCGAFCQYRIGLEGIYSGGTFYWTVEIIRVNRDRKVLGTVCPAPEPYMFIWP
ncbi:MAG TPA: hypothetical protein VJ754_06070 [Anaerolineae bacterium]|nr:hypothetical protein [Anaerolineae bacterium]